MADKSDPLWSFPAPLFSLLSPLESIPNGWYGLPFLDVSSIPTHITALHRTITHLTLFQVFHSLYMAREMRLHAHPDQSSIQLFLAYIACSLGGTALSSFLLGQPPGWLAVDAVCVCYVVSFVLMRYEPFASHFMRLFDIPLLLPLLVFMQDVGFSHAVTSFGIDRCLLSPSSLHAVAHPAHATPTPSFPYFHPPTHQSLFSALAAGWLSGCGGGLLRFGLRLPDRQWELRFPSEVLGGGGSVHVRMALWLGVAYYAMCNPHGWLGVTLLGRPDAKLVVMAVVVSQVSGKRLVRWLQSRSGSGSGKGVEAAVADTTAGNGSGSEGAAVSQPAESGKQTRRAEPRRLQPEEEAADNEEADGNGVHEEPNSEDQRTRRRSTRVKRQ